jgi:two-component system OmpR family response regulator
MPAMRVLIIEDDKALSDALARGLEEAGHAVCVRHTGPDGVVEAMAEPYDALVLDWMLPGQDGPSVCRELRARGNHTAVLMLTARGALADRIGGLDAGADDYLTKPFSFDELLARLRVFARRAGRREVLTVGDLVVDRDRRTVTQAENPVEVTAREFDLLALLAQRAGRVVTRFQIFDEIWDGETDLRSNALDVHVANLRAKIGRENIQTVRGIGFRLADPAASDS